MKLAIVYKENEGSSTYRRNRNKLVEQIQDKIIQTIEFDIDEDIIDIVFIDNSVLSIVSAECNCLSYKDSAKTRLAGLRD